MFSIFRRPSRSLLKGTINALNENLSDRGATIASLRTQLSEAEDARILAANYTAATIDHLRSEIKILERQVDTMIDASRLAIEILS